MKQANEEEDDVHDIPSLEELPSILQNKDELNFSTKYLVNVNIGTSDQERLIDIGATLPT